LRLPAHPRAVREQWCVRPLCTHCRNARIRAAVREFEHLNPFADLAAADPQRLIGNGGARRGVVGLMLLMLSSEERERVLAGWLVACAPNHDVCECALYFGVRHIGWGPTAEGWVAAGTALAASNPRLAAALELCRRARPALK
jgi:hypothetical protein